MTSDGLRRRHVHVAALAALLALVAGFVAAVGYLALNELFVANMTGNTVVASVNLAQQDWPGAVRRAFLILPFVLGAACGAAVIGFANRHRWRSAHAAAFAVEGSLLIAFVVLAQPAVRDGVVRSDPATLYALAAVPTLAMGVQSTSFRRIGSGSLRTTFVTGILTSLAEGTVALVLGDARPRDATRRADPRAASRPVASAAGRVIVLAGVWTAYASGALFGALTHAPWGLAALAVPITILALVALWDLIQPDTPVE